MPWRIPTNHHGWSGYGQCWDNAVAESFFGTLREELVYRSVFLTRAHAGRAIFQYIEVFYNRRRLYSALGYVSPANYEKRQYRQHRAA